MKALNLLLGLAAASSSLTALACENPSLPVIPEREGIEGRAKQDIQDDTLRYLTAMSSYVACIQAEYEATGDDDASSMQASLLAMRNNSAVAELEAVRKVYEAWIGPIDELGGRPADGGAAALNCISVGPDLTSVVVDGETILFYTQNREIYRNTLQQSCPLRRNGGFTYDVALTRGARICNGTWINPELGGRCRLGPFHPISQSEAEALRR